MINLETLVTKGSYTTNYYKTAARKVLNTAFPTTLDTCAYL